MDKIHTLVKCFNGPRLHHICKQLNLEDICIDYTTVHRTSVERWCDLVFDTYNWLATIVKYLSPFIVYNAYKHGLESYIAIVRVSAVPLVSFYLFVYLLRGTARVFTPTYVDFVKEYYSADSSSAIEVRRTFLRKYNFDFHRWKPDYTATFGSSLNDIAGAHNVPFILQPFYYVMATWVGKPLAYPGATYPINALLRSQLDAGRVDHMSSRKNLTRTKIRAADGNDIDSMFVDNRNTETGQQLVITCEGNAAFYEVGCFEIPQKIGYSVLGWNHPGFAYSTGLPFADADANAIEGVYQYAVEVLGFAPEDIIVYGWSIGGFPTAYIASAHPDIGNVIIDASFDDIVPMALPRMPEFLESVTIGCCRKYFNLHNSKLITNYPGPIRVIRRNKDEIITTKGHGDPSSNRGNELLVAILESRYPALFKDTAVRRMVEDWLEHVSPVPRRMSVPGLYDPEFCKQQIQQSVAPHTALGEGLTEPEKVMVAYYLFSKYLIDCEGGHNTPLPLKYFKLPWAHADEL